MIIKRLSYLDYPKIKQLIPYLGSSDNLSSIKAILELPSGILNDVLPLKYMYKEESYILTEKDEILGLITIEPTIGNPYKINISRLVFKQDLYDIGKQLVDFVVSKYGAKGAHSFSVFIDICHDELCTLFSEGCNFRQCSYENLWKLENFTPLSPNCAKFRNCQNSDAKEVAHLYNSELNTLYRPSMERIPHEYYDNIFGGFNPFYKNRYVLDYNDKIISYLSITTVDNWNFIIDVSLNDGFDFDYDELINFALKEIKRRKSQFTAFIKHRQYAKNADKFEEYLHSRELNCVQTQCVFVKDFYKPIKDVQNVLQAFSIGENRIVTN